MLGQKIMNVHASTTRTKIYYAFYLGNFKSEEWLLFLVFARARYAHVQGGDQW